MNHSVSIFRGGGVHFCCFLCIWLTGLSCPLKVCHLAIAVSPCAVLMSRYMAAQSMGVVFLARESGMVKQVDPGMVLDSF